MFQTRLKLVLMTRVRPKPYKRKAAVLKNRVESIVWALAA